MAANINFELTSWGDEALKADAEGLTTPKNKPTKPADTNAPKRPTKTKPATADPATAAAARALDFATNRTNRFIALEYDDSE